MENFRKIRQIYEEHAKQLNEIRKVTLARVICDNTKHMDEVQPRIFLEKDPFLNAMMHCSGPVIPRMDLAPWSTSSPHFAVSGTLLADSVARANRDLRDVMRKELDLWQQRECTSPCRPVSGPFTV
ncbi:hypothetical protein PR048_017199 [Dryococelus australis]|uniref:Uncharacterized protein n=1 Tax=Dryococelus australis TaxID=614101 RepID=A0ABQ9H8V5_9NEOP|nr:hypothetical protein PR048_017199 [Dryococelus australis]